MFHTRNGKIKRFVSKGDAALEEGRWSEAEESFRQALRLDPKQGLVWLRLGEVLERQERFMQAIEVYQEAVMMRHEGAESRLDMALARAGQALNTHDVTQSGDAVPLVDSTASGFEFSAPAETKDEMAPKGSAHLELGLIIVGWYCDPTAPDRVTTITAVDANGRVVAEGHTRCAPTVAGAETGTTTAGFRLLLPSSLLDGRLHTITLNVNGAPAVFAPLVVDGACLGCGSVEGVEDNKVRGWAISYAHPSSPVVVEAVVDGATIGLGRADKFRPDVAAAIRTSGFHGFEFSLERSLLASEFDSLVVRIAESRTPLTFLSGARPVASQASKNLKPAMREPSQELRGVLDRVDSTGASGWALDLARPETPVCVSLKLDGVSVGSVLADATRPDVGRVHKTKGRHGFHIAFPPGLGVVGKITVDVVFGDTGDSLTNSPASYEIPVLGMPHPRANASSSSLNRYLYRPSTHVVDVKEPSVAVIVINRNGATYLDNFLKSFQQYNSYRNYKLVVVDHGSTDDSQLVCRRWSTDLNLTFIPRGVNYSFSASNNFGADHFDGDILFFINNDIVISQDILPMLVRYLGDPEVGIVGIKLRSIPPAASKGFSALVRRDSFVQHIGVKLAYRSDKVPVSAYELPLHPDAEAIAETPWEVAAVTGAALMMRRKDFIEVGGFDEGYFYGYEDVDLCLSVRGLLNKKVLCANNVFAYHVRGATRAFEEQSTRDRYASNFQHLSERYGASTRRAVRREAIDGGRFYRFEPLRIAFAVSTIDMAAPEADFFTAYELGQFFAELYGWEVTYLPPKHWYELDNFDVVVAMRHDYDPRKIVRSNWNLTRVAWPRNWFERWLDSPSLPSFDLIWSASRRAVAEFSSRTTIPVEFFPIATNERRFEGAREVDEYRSDYCFTGSFFMAPRDIVNCLQPETLPYKFALFGHNWNMVPWLIPYWRKSLPYDAMPDVYGSTRIVLDDANHTVKAWGSVNSRVFDALAAGCLVITNGQRGNEEMFDGLLPVYSSAEELSAHLLHYLEDEAARLALVEKVRAIVIENHTYRHRAITAKASLSRLMSQKRYAVRDLPSLEKASWVASLITDSLRAQGIWTRLFDATQALKAVEQLGDDIVLHVSSQGAFRHTELTGDQTHVRIHLGSPDEISLREAASYDLLVLVDALSGHALARSSTPILTLFENPAAAEECFVIAKGGAVVFTDARKLRRALDILLPEMLRKIEDIDARKHAAKRAERLPQPGVFVDGLLESGEIDLFYWPDYSATNPYQRMLYQDLPEYVKVRPGAIQQALAAQLAEGRRRPVVFHLHWTSPIAGVEESEVIAERRVDDFLKALEAFRAAGGKLIWTIHNVLPHELRFPELEKRLCRSVSEVAEVIHVHSESVIDLAAPYYPLPAEKIIIGPHGNYIGVYPDEIDRAAARARLNLSGDDDVFLFFGQVRGYKGIDELLDAIAALPQVSPPRRLLIVGKPVNLDSKELASRACGIEGVEMILREIPDDEIQLYMRAADFVVLPYRNVLTSGSVYLALSFGVPVIAPKSGLVTEVVREGEGFLYDPTTKGGLAQALRRAVLLNAQERQSFSKAAFARAQALDWSTIRHAIFDSIIASTVGRRIKIPVGEITRHCLVAEPKQGNAHSARVAAIVLHYQHVEDTIRCVISLLNQDYASTHIYIVSNDEDWRAFVALSRMFPHCTVIQSPDNLGYAGGNNIALALARTRGIDYFWIVNPDAVAPPNYLSKMIEIADLNDSVTIFGSKILFGDRPDTIWFAGGKVDFEEGLETSHMFIGKKSANAPDLPITCDYVTGASLLARVSTLNEVGYIPEQYFLYFEETDWCLAAKRKGLGIVTYPSIHLYHHKRSEDGGAPTLTFLYYYCRNALLMCASFEAEKVAATEQRVRQKASVWLQQVAMARPNELGIATRVVEKGLSDGRAGRSGRVNFLAELNSEFQPAIELTPSTEVCLSL